MMDRAQPITWPRTVDVVLVWFTVDDAMAWSAVVAMRECCEVGDTDAD